ncbi:MAG: hypothetical protein U0136_13975 [Bdellovibrionota bacterium]
MDLFCAVSNSKFNFSTEDQALLERLSPRINGVTYPLPPPKLSPDERKRRRWAFRNERHLYHRKCDFSGKAIVTNYSPDKKLTVYSKEDWWSDNWDFRSYGRDFDFNRPFFEQFADLFAVVPKVALTTSPDADENNCRYINFAGSSKNCHMVFDSDFDEDCYFSNVLKHSKNCADCSYVHSSELCYECVDCTNCYALLYSQNCASCSESYFLDQCVGCSNCCLSANLVQKQYYFRNKPYSREGYFRLVESLELEKRTSVESLRESFRVSLLDFPKKYCQILRSENCTGDYIVNSRNIHSSFNVASAEDLRYCDSLYAARNCMDVSSFGEQIDHVYQSGTIGINVTNTFFSLCAVANCADLFYSVDARMSRHCFGSAGVKRAQFCILNKQYTEEEYFRLLPRIIAHMQATGEWGEFFPISLSPFGYNETIAQDFFPLTETEAGTLGAKWSNYLSPAPDVPALSAEAVPDTIDAVTADVLKKAIQCPISNKVFRIADPELALYRKLRIPLPTKHPDVRHQRRMALRNPQHLWARQCAKTGERILSTYSPESQAIVYGESAFLESVHA